MTNIDLRKFVDINIQQRIERAFDGTRETVALISDKAKDATVIYDSLDKMKNNVDDVTYSFAQVYFLNGGSKISLIKIDSMSVENVSAAISSLPDEIICAVAVSENNSREDVYNVMQQVAQNRSNVYGIKEKILIASSTSDADESSTKNFIAKYSTQDGSEMTIAAYLSKIDVYGIDTVHDYAFTQDIFANSDYNGENIDDALYDTLMANNFNVDVSLVNAIRNVGGNCKDGSDIVNNFVRIVLHQTLTQRLTALLTQKLKSSSGVSKIYNVIANELEKYLTCGYLTTDKIWSNEDLSIQYGSKKYTIIEKGTPLTSGYIIRVLPLSALTTEDVAARKTPPIYIILADQYGIRKITINGEVI